MSQKVAKHLQKTIEGCREDAEVNNYEEGVVERRITVLAEVARVASVIDRDDIEQEAWQVSHDLFNELIGRGEHDDIE